MTRPRACFNIKKHLSVYSQFPLQWRHNGCDGVSTHRCFHCLLNRLFGRRSKKTSKHQSVTGLYDRNHRWPVDSPHKGPVTQKMFPFDDVIMHYRDKTVSCFIMGIPILVRHYLYIETPPSFRERTLWGVLPWVNSPHKGPVTRKMFPFDDVIMTGLQTLPIV